MNREDDIPLLPSDDDLSPGSSEQQSRTTRPEKEQSFSNDSADDDSLIEYLARLSPIPTDNTAIKKQQQQLPTGTSYSRGSYFKDKELKQKQQDERLRQHYNANNKRTSQLFKDCIIYINGYTKPSRLQLHEMIVLHGGQFRHYLTAKGKVTHIVASNLPLRKRLEFKSYRVVKPEWITESIRQMKLLPWQDFATLHEAGGNGDQPQLQLYRTVSAATTTATTTTVPNCNDPDFIRNYLASSRLHHLSNWKANLRREFLEYYPPPPKANPTTAAASKYVLFHVDFDCFFATVAYHHTKSLNPSIDIDMDRDPIVVCHGTNNSDIASSNYVARGYGIKNGMWVSHAKTLLPRGVALRVLPYCFEEFEIVSKKFYKVLRDMSVFKYVVPVSIDEAICVVIASSGDMDPEFCENVCREVQERVFQSTDGCNVSIGCAPSLVLARLALRLGKPNGYYVITDADAAGSTFWSKFQLGDLPGIGGSSAQKLRNEFGASNLQTLEDLRQVATPERLKRCLGPKLGERVNLALYGKDDPESIKLVREPHSLFERKTLSLDINWAIRFSNIHEVDLFLERCTSYLIEKLTEDLDKYVSQIGLKIMKRAEGAPIEPPKYLGMGRCDALSTSSRLGVATNEFGVIATEVKYLFRTLNCPPMQVRGVAVQFNKLIDPPARKNKNTSALSSPKKLGALDEFFSPFKHNGTSTREKRLRDTEGTPTSGSTNGKVGISDYSTVVPKLPYVSPNRNDKPDEMDSIRAKYKKLNISPVKRLDQLKGESYQENFLRELPTQIRRNLQQDLRILKKVNESKAGKIKKRVEQQKEAERKTYSHFRGPDSIFRPVEFQQMKSFKRICDTIIGWVKNTIEDEGPHESDVRIFQNYLIRLAESNKLHLVLRISKLISQTLALKSGSSGELSGFQEWDQILLGTVVPILNRNRHSYQTERSLDIEFDL